MKPTKDQLLEDLLVEWEVARQAGELLSADELCKNCPDLEVELTLRIKKLEATSWLLDDPTTQHDPFEQETTDGRPSSLTIDQFI